MPTPSYLSSLLTIGPPSSKTTVGPKCVVGASSRLDEKTSVKRSVLGKHVRVGKNCKVANSVVADHCVLEDGCSVEGGAVCAGATVGERCVLKDCFIGAGYVVPAGCEFKGQVLYKKTPGGGGGLGSGPASLVGSLSEREGALFPAYITGGPGGGGADAD